MTEDCLCWVTQRNQVALVLMDFYNCLIFLEIFCVIVKIYDNNSPDFLTFGFNPLATLLQNSENISTIPDKMLGTK